MAHYTDTMSLHTQITTASQAPIGTLLSPIVILTLPPRYHALNASIPIPTQITSVTPGGPTSSGHSPLGFILKLPSPPFRGPFPSSIGSTTALLTKLPPDIPKFDGKEGEDLNNHVMNFHLWCLSNSLMDDSIHLRLFQRNLTGSAVKWYIELPRGFFVDFNTLTIAFLTHYQLPIHYETGTDILSSFKQTKSIHISNHIHEWRW
jgi:hypothetical protein